MLAGRIKHTRTHHTRYYLGHSTAACPSVQKIMILFLLLDIFTPTLKRTEGAGPSL